MGKGDLMRLFFARVALPILLFVMYAFALNLWFSGGNLLYGLTWIGFALLLLWWAVHIMRWLYRGGAPPALVYVGSNLLTVFGIFFLSALLAVSIVRIAPEATIVLLLAGAACAVIWLAASLIHLLRTRRYYDLKSRYWWLLASESWLWRFGSPQSATLRLATKADQGDGAVRPTPSPKAPAALSPRTYHVAPSGSHAPAPAARASAPQTSPAGSPYHPLPLNESAPPPTGIKIPVRPAAPLVSLVPQPVAGPVPPQPKPLEPPLLPEAGNYFVAAARKAANENGRPCNFTPFEHYWPIYENMSPAQRCWYMYWRSELRAGKCLPTDLSYLFVHVYELINLVGAADHADAYRRLVHLWLTYRPAFPKLDRYLVDWIADFIIVQKLGIDPFDWYVFACQVGAGSQIEPDLLLEAHATGHLPLPNFPPAVLYRISTYSPRQSKFYRMFAQEMQLDAAYTVGLTAVDAVQRSTTQKGLLQSFRSGRAYTLRREPFMSALHGYSLQEISVAKVHPWTSDPQLGESLALALRHTENVLRTSAKYRSLLRGVSIPPQWDAAITAVLAPKPVRRTLEIDPTSVEALRAESEEVRRRLMVADEPAAPTPLSTVTQKGRTITIDDALAASFARQSEEVRMRLLAADDSEDAVSPTPAPASDAASGARMVTRPAGTPEGMLTDLSAVATVLNSSQGDAVRLLRHLREHNWQMSAASANRLFAGGFANVTFDLINETALETLGDALLFDEGGEWVVADDYRDEVDYLLDHPGEVQPSAVQAAAVQASEPPILDANWRTFALRLQPWHYQALAVLALEQAGQAATAKLDAVARSRMSTANQLVDDINTIAQETVGDNVLDASELTVSIYEEHAERLTTLAQWALDSGRTEVAT